MTRAILLILALGALFANAAIAHPEDIFSFYCPSGLGDGSSTCPDCEELRLVQSEIRYHVAPELFTWRSFYEPDAQGRLPDAVWIVVSEGPDPQDTTDEFAILYGDVATGRVSAYVYDKIAGSQSWQTQSFITSFPNGLTTTVVNGVTEIAIVVDVSAVNSYAGPADWKGVQFGWTIGFWAAALCNTTYQFDDGGQILGFSSDSGDFADCRCRYDRNDRTSGPPISIERSSWGVLKSQYRE